MHYKIQRGLQTGKSLNTTQRTSSLFAEEPVVLGKVFRRGYPPIILSETQFELNKTHLRRLEKAGSIIIKEIRVDTAQSETPAENTPPPPQETITPEPIKVAEEVVVGEVTENVAPVETPTVEEVTETPKSKKGKNK